MASVTDVLHQDPLPRGDLSGLRDALSFAFEGGDVGDAFERMIGATPLAPSTLRAGDFATQLFLSELVSSVFEIRLRGRRVAPHAQFLERAFASPPRAPADRRARQTVLAALVADANLRARLERLYVALRQLRKALESPGQEASEGIRRKIEILAATKEAIDALAEGFDGTDGAPTPTSILARLGETGRRMRARAGYERLAQLLDFDRDLATVDLRLGLGSDGRVRGFEVLAVRENRDNVLVAPPWRRFLSRLVAWFRGYRYSESEVVVRLVDEVFTPLADDMLECLSLTAGIELYLASLSFRDRVTEHGLAVCLPELFTPDDEAVERELSGVFNPLLLLQGVDPEPCDIAVDRWDSLAIVTGPNSGGKTRLLQAIGLVQLLGQVGVFVPARHARLCVAHTLFVSLLEEASAAQREGRLGTELARIRRLFEQLEPGSMAIVDELSSGTNPAEGERIFELVVSLLPRLRGQVFVSTHYLELARRLSDENVRGLAFLQVELADDVPTYRFVPGVAHSSLALGVARRLGVTRDELERLVDSKVAASRR